MDIVNVPANYTAARDLMHGRVVLITGAGDGIGRAIAKGLAAHGATVVLLGNTVAKLESVYDEIQTDGGPLPGIYPMDLRGATYTDYQNLAGILFDKYARLDGLLHNAGILGERAPIEHHAVEIWQQVLQVNLSAPFMLTRACMPLFYKSADASVLFTASGVGRKPRAYWGSYAVSKAGIEALSTLLADETEFRGTLRFNTLNPGAVRTQMRLAAFPAEDRSLLRAPEELLPAYLYLLGPDSRGVTGKQFAIG